MAEKKKELDLAAICDMVKIPDGEIRARSDIECGSAHLITLDGLQSWDEDMMRGLVLAAARGALDGVVPKLPTKTPGAKIVLAVQVLP